MAANPERILVVGPAWVGDMVMAQTLFRHLAEVRGATVDVLAPEWSAPLLGRMPQVRRAISVPFGHGDLALSARRNIGRRLREGRYDQAIVLPRSLKSALIPWFARIPRRTGFRGELRYGLINDMRRLDKERLPQVTHRYVALGTEETAAPPDILPPRLGVDEASRAALLARLGLSPAAPVVAFAPGAEYGPAKRWPEERFAELARRLLTTGLQVWQFGSARDREVAERIDRLAGGGTRVLCGETALVDSVDLLSLARVLVTNDSGLMHVAAAVGVRIVALYGSTTPDYTPPLAQQKRILYRQFDCSPCFQRVCPKGDPAPCLAAITVQETLDAALQLLDETRT